MKVIIMKELLEANDRLAEDNRNYFKENHVGQNIAQTRSEIEDTMDTINDAFEKLLDSLFEDVA